MGEFRDLLMAAKNGSQEAFERMTEIEDVKNILNKWSCVRFKPDEDMHQEMLITLYHVIQTFPVDRYAR